MRNEIKFCDRCGDSLANKTVEGKQRQTCTTCGHTVFLDPKLAVVVLVSTEEKLVLVRRAIEPALGHWAFPSGYVDRGETVENAAIREVKEETGLDIKITQRLLGPWASYPKGQLILFKMKMRLKNINLKMKKKFLMSHKQHYQLMILKI